MNPREHQFVCRLGQRLRYRACGAGPALVLINGYGASDELFVPLCERLSSSFEVLTWTLRGLDGEWNGPGFGVDDHVNDLMEILEHSQHRSAHVVGWCSGAKIAIVAAHRHPERVVAQTLLCPNVMPLGPEFEGQTTPFQRNLRTLGRLVSRRPEIAESVVDTLNDRQTSRSGAPPLADIAPPSIRTLVMQPFERPDGLRRYAAMLNDYYEHDVQVVMEHSATPTHVIVANQDRVVDPRIGTEAARRIHGARVTVLDGSDHYCQFTEPDAIARMIQSFHGS